MLLSDEYLITYCTTNLHCITRRAPFGQANRFTHVTIDFQQETTPNDVVTVIATQPLTNNEPWQKMERGKLKVFRFGEQISAIATERTGSLSSCSLFALLCLPCAIIVTGIT